MLLLHAGFVPNDATIANLYVGSVTGLIDATPKNLKAAEAFADELHEDVVESLLPRAADLLDALNELADHRDRLFDAIGAEQDAKEELADHRRELQALARAAKRRTVRHPVGADDSDDDAEVDIEDYIDEREQEQLENHLIPTAAAKQAAAQAEREAAMAAAQDQLGQVHTALQAFEDR